MNAVEKIRIFSVRARSFVYLNDQYVLNESYLNDISLLAISPNEAFCYVYIILATCLHNPAIFLFSSYKGI